MKRQLDEAWQEIAVLKGQLAESENLRTGVELGMDCANAEAVRLRKQLAEWNEKAKNWTASPEAGKMLDGYRTLAAKCAELETERDKLGQRLAATENALAELEEACDLGTLKANLATKDVLLARSTGMPYTTEGARAVALEQQLAKREKQVVMLRDALFNQLNDCINFNGGQLTICIMEASTKALDATQDLSGCILCDAEPVGVIDEDDDARWGDIYTDTDVRVGTPLYKARKP